jgi:hypothetical protein
MDGTVAEGRLSAPSSAALDCRVAGSADDAELRRLLRDNPMGGWVAVSFEREPCYFAPLLASDEHQAIIALDPKRGEAVGMCARTVRRAFIEGEECPLGYIGELRIAQSHRRRFRILREGFEALRRDLHQPLRTPYYLTAIISDNQTARRLLEADLPGKPTYRPLADCTTLAIRTSASTEERCVAACDRDVPEIATCLSRNLRRYQFAPVWTEADIRAAQKAGGPGAGDFILYRRDGQVVGCIALWDQSRVRQAVIRGYDSRIALLRPLLNATGTWTGLPRLPKCGEALRQVYLAFAAVDGDDPEVLRALVGAALEQAQRRGFTVGVIALADANPMLPALKAAFRARAYRSRLYLVHWDHGRAAVARLQPRIPYVEASLL